MVKVTKLPCSWIGRCGISPRTLGRALVGGISPGHDAADWRQLPFAFLQIEIFMNLFKVNSSKNCVT